MNKEQIELQFMPRARQWRILINDKSLTRRFFDRPTATREFERRKAKLKGIKNE